MTHDAENLYCYIRTTGIIGRTSKGEPVPEGKYYHPGGVVITSRLQWMLITMTKQATGYMKGGTYPTSPGYDMNVEIEWYNGEFNTGMYMNKCCLDKAELQQNYLALSQGKYEEGKMGPYPAGYHIIKKGQYDHYPEWVYHEDGTITFVKDGGPVVHGVVDYKLSEDGHELEMKHPFVGFLKDQHGKPVAEIGRVFDICLNIQASGELTKENKWSGDGAIPINGYKLE
ncbi:MAG: hypothetical protein R3C11_27550 [Planctomycetaceae bacterium]